MTPCMSSKYSNHLSYASKPKGILSHIISEINRKTKKAKKSPNHLTTQTDYNIISCVVV